MILSDCLDRSEFRKNFFENFKVEEKNSIVLLFSGDQQTKYDTDTDLTYRVESNYFYLTGIQSEPGCYAAFNLEKKEFALFVPEYGDDFALWCGEYPKKEDFKKKTNADHVIFLQDMENFLIKEWEIKKIYCLKMIPEFAKKIEIEKKIEINSSKLYTELTKLRLIKQKCEFDHMRKVCKITADGFKYAMEKVKPNMFEFQVAGNFKSYIFSQGCKNNSFETIAAGGSRGSTLHYNRNDQILNDGDLIVLDAGAEYNQYCGDITRTFPVNGKFSEKQKSIYEIVLKANEEVIKNLKPGIDFTEMHLLAERIVAKGLLDLGILKGDLEQDILKNHVQAVFFPHGLGHSLGIDTHDPPNRDGSFEKINRPGACYLRIRCTLKEGICITVEPGIYFIKRMIEKSKKDEKVKNFINYDLIEKEYINFGGVRIEDDVLITKDGYEVLTSNAPKKVIDIENLFKN